MYYKVISLRNGVVVKMAELNSTYHIVHWDLFHFESKMIEQLTQGDSIKPNLSLSEISEQNVCIDEERSKPKAPR